MRSTDNLPHMLDGDRIVSRHVREAAARAHEQLSGIMPADITALIPAVKAGVVSRVPTASPETIPAAAIDRMRSTHDALANRCLSTMPEFIRHG